MVGGGDGGVLSQVSVIVHNPPRKSKFRQDLLLLLLKYCTRQYAELLYSWPAIVTRQLSEPTSFGSGAALALGTED